MAFPSYKLSRSILPYNSEIPPLGIYLDKTTTLKDTCTPMIIASVFITDRTWKQPRCPSIDEWIKKMWYIYAMENYSATKMNILVHFS